MTVVPWDVERARTSGVGSMSDEAFGAFVNSGDGDSHFAETALKGAFYNIRGGPPQMSGVHQGSDVNYYYQGFLWAERGTPRDAMDLAIRAHNVRQYLMAPSAGERKRNMEQIERAQLWAGWGYEHYRSTQR